MLARTHRKGPANRAGITSAEIIKRKTPGNAGLARNIEARVPWLAVAFYGPNEVGVNVIDDTLFDLIRTQQTQQGVPDAGLGPGEIPNVIEHVEGGTGVFGSYAEARQRIEVYGTATRDRSGWAR